MIPALLVTLLLSPDVAAQVSSPGHAVAQARHFVKKGWHEDARQELEDAVRTPQGSRDFEVRWMLSQVCYELLDVGCAVEHARAAVDLAPEDGVRAEVQGALEAIASVFVPLEVAGPHAGLVSRLQVEPAASILDPELKRYANRVALKLKEQTTLPVEVWLPAGPWRVNGREVALEVGAPARLDLPMNALGSRGLASLQVLRLEVSGGFGVLFGQRVQHLLPAAETQIALTQPIGRALVGLTVDRSFRSYEIEDHGTAGSPWGWTGGVRLGTELFLDGPLAVRPFVGYRTGWLPGIGFDCVEGGDGVLACAPDGPATEHLVVPAWVHVPSAEVAVDWREGGRITALGVGVRAGVDGVFGSVPETLEAASVEDPDHLRPVTVTGRSFSAVGVRFMANVSFAF